MNLKKIAVATALFTANLQPAIANSKVIFNFNGEILSLTCEVNTASKNLVIILPTVSAAVLKEKAATAGHTKFQIRLDKCKMISSIDPVKNKKGYLEHLKLFNDKAFYAFFKSDYVDTENDHTLKNAATKNAAHNVNVQFTNSDGSAIKVGSASKAAEFDLMSSYIGGEKFSAEKENYTLDYGVQYYSTGKAVAGIVETFATFTIQYK